MAYITTDRIAETSIIADAFFELIPKQRPDEHLPAPSADTVFYTNGRSHDFLRVPEFAPQKDAQDDEPFNFYLKMLRRGMTLCTNKGLSNVALALPLLPPNSSTESPRDALEIAFRAEKAFYKEKRENKSWEDTRLDIIFVVNPKDFPNASEEFFDAISFVDENFSYARAIYSARRLRHIRFSIDEIDFEEPEDTFSEKLFQLIREHGGDEVAVYTRAMVDRRLFSKIRSDRNYRPSKQTVLAFAIALKLGIYETEELLESAGFALSKSIRYDLAVRFFIENEIYDFNKINDLLFCYNFPLFGQPAR